jgi:hypothetical protein
VCIAAVCYEDLLEKSRILSTPAISVGLDLGRVETIEIL